MYHLPTHLNKNTGFLHKYFVPFILMFGIIVLQLQNQFELFE